MVKKDKTSFCDITKALQSIAPIFYTALDNVCLLTLLTRYPKSGITLLIPTDKSVQTKCLSLSESDSPEQFIQMGKSVILVGKFSSPDELENQQVSNRLNQYVEVKDGKWGPFTIKPSGIKFFDHRQNMSILFLEGKGDIPINGKPASMRNKEDLYEKEITGSSRKKYVKGGDEVSLRKALNDKLSKIYEREMFSEKNNAYVKKVNLQLRLMRKKYSSECPIEKVVKYLGNEEISDSLLLDMISPQELFKDLWEAFGDSPDPSILGSMSDQNVGNQTHHESYISEKQKVIEESGLTEDIVENKLKKNQAEQLNAIKNIQVSSDLRNAVIQLYGGKDNHDYRHNMFLCYVNIMKERWQSDLDMARFTAFIQMINTVHTTLNTMTNYTFEVCFETTMYGYILRSDIYKFVPWTRPDIYTKFYPITREIIPVSLKLFSLNNLVNSNQIIGGGENLLKKYFPENYGYVADDL